MTPRSLAELDAQRALLVVQLDLLIKLEADVLLASPADPRAAVLDAVDRRIRDLTAQLEAVDEQRRDERELARRHQFGDADA